MMGIERQQGIARRPAHWISAFFRDRCRSSMDRNSAVARTTSTRRAIFRQHRKRIIRFGDGKREDDEEDEDKVASAAIEVRILLRTISWA